MLKSLLLFVTLAAVPASLLCAQDTAVPTEAPSAATEAPVPAAPEPALERGMDEAAGAAGVADEAPVTPTPAPAAEPDLDLMPSNSGQLLPPPALTTEPLPLIPEAPEPTERPRTSDIQEPRREKKSSTEEATNEMKERIRYREVKTRALKDPAIQAEWERAHKVGTDYEKRESLKKYYTMLYARMARIDKTLKKRIAEQERTSIRRLTQTRIDPTEPLDIADRTQQLVNE
jgi:hypothetical protein